MKGFMEGVGARYLTVVVMAVLLASLFSVLVPMAKAEQNAPVMISPGYWETPGTWVIEAGDYVVHGNRTIYVNGNLIIEGQGTLVLYNVTLQINSTFPGEFYIEVQSGGTFLVYDGGDGLTPFDLGDSDWSQIQPPGAALPFRFYIRSGADFLLNRSRIVQCGLPVVGDPTYGDDLGVYSESDLTTIEDSILDWNSVGLVVNHSTATVSRTAIYNSGYGVVGAENALLDFTQVDIIWSSDQGIFLNGSRMYNNDSWIARNGFGPGVMGIYVIQGSTLVMDNCFILQNAGGGAFSRDSTMVVMNSQVVDNFGAGLYWSASPGIDVVATATDNWIELHSRAMQVEPWQGNAHVEFWRNNITDYGVGTAIVGLDVTGNFIGNTLWRGTMGLVVDAESVDMDVLGNSFDRHEENAITVFSNVFAILDVERNRINNTYLSGYHGIYFEPQQFIDARIANNTITNVTAAGVAVNSFMDAYVVAWVFNNTLLNVSADCMNICGAVYLYSFGGDLDVVVYENYVDWIGDAGILVMTDLGDVTASIGFNDVWNIGVMPSMWPGSIVTLAWDGFLDVNMVSNTVVNNFVWWGILGLGFYGVNANITGNTVLNTADWAIFLGSGPAPAIMTSDLSYNNIDSVTGGIYFWGNMADGIISMYGNEIHNYNSFGIGFDQLANLTLDAYSNNVGTGDGFALGAMILGDLDAVLDSNVFAGSNLDHMVYLMVQGQANLTMLNNDIYSAALDGFHLEASSANLIMEWNQFAGSRVNFNATAMDPFGHLMIDSYFDFFLSSTASYPLRVYAEGTADITMDYTYSLYNLAEITFELNRSTVMTISRSWIRSNLATGWMIWHSNELLDLAVLSSSFRENDAGLVVQSNADARITVSGSWFNENTFLEGLNAFAAGDLNMSVSNSEFSGNSAFGLSAWAFGTINYAGRSNIYAINQWDGLFLGSFVRGEVDISTSEFIANCQGMMGCSGLTLEFSMSLGANVTLNGIEAVGNDMYGIRMYNADARITSAAVHGHTYGIISAQTNAIIESSRLDMNNNSLYLDFNAHFTVFNSTLASAALADYVLDWNSSLWCINSTVRINDGIFYDTLSWAKRSWYTDIEVRTNIGVPIAGAWVNATDTFGTPYISGTTGLDGFLRLNLVDDRWVNTSTSVNYNTYDITADASGVGSVATSYGFYAYVHLVLVINDVDGPIADAGPDQIVDEDTVVQFNGTGSTDNVMIQTYVWTFTDQGSPVTLYGPTPTYIFTEPGVYTVTLEVDDFANPPDTDTVQITVLDVTGPTADAGPDQNVPSGTTVMFDGSGSSDNVGVVNYTWTFTHNATPVTLYGVNPSFTFWTPGNYVVILNVRDSASNGGVDNMVVTVFDADPPVADAGLDQIVDEDTVVVFDGSGSTDNIGIVSYMWTFIEGANVVTLMGVAPTYTFKDPGGHVVTLTVRDAAGMADVDTMTVTVLDATPPTVIFTSPYDGATDQPLSTSVVIGFSEPMDTLSVEAAITISSGAQIIAFNWNAQDDIVTLTLFNLTYSSMYVVTVGATSTDAYGIPMTADYFFNFMTTAAAGPDIIPPEVIYSYPEDGAVDVPIAIVLKVVFSEPMNTIMTESAILVDGAVPMSFNWLSNNTLVEITVAPFSYSTIHTLSVSTAAVDAAGNPLSTDYNIQFTAEDAPAVDVIPPEIIYTNPEDGELGVPVAASVFLVFSEPMNTASVEALGVVTIDQGATISSYVWTPGDTVLELQLSGVAQGTLYTVTVTTGAEDLAGNPMAADFTFQYTTFAPGADTTRPEIWYTFPDDGDTDISVGANLIIVFSEPMNRTSVEGAINISGVTPIGFQWTSGDTTVEVLLPMLSYSNSYLVTINNTAADLAGNTIFEPYLILFQTEAQPGVDTTPPEVVFIYPDDGDTDVPVSNGEIILIIVFSEPMDESSVEGALSISDGTLSGHQWSQDSSSLTVVLSGADYDTDYTLTIGSGAEDLAGNSLSQEVVDFTTMAEPEGPPAPEGEFDIAQAWWLILIIIVLIVVIMLLLLMRRRPSVPVMPVEPMPEEEVPELDELIEEEPAEPPEPPAPDEPPSDEDVTVY